MICLLLSECTHCWHWYYICSDWRKFNISFVSWLYVHGHCLQHTLIGSFYTLIASSAKSMYPELNSLIARIKINTSLKLKTLPLIEKLSGPEIVLYCLDLFPYANYHVVIYDQCHCSFNLINQSTWLLIYYSHMNLQNFYLCYWYSIKLYINYNILGIYELVTLLSAIIFTIFFTFWAIIYIFACFSKIDR